MFRIYTNAFYKAAYYSQMMIKMMMNKRYVFFIVYKALLHILYHFILIEALWNRHYCYHFYFISEEIRARENLSDLPKVTEQDLGSNPSLLTTNCVSFPSVATSPLMFLGTWICFSLKFSGSTIDLQKSLVMTVTERQRRWKGRGLCTRWRNKKKSQKNN